MLGLRPVSCDDDTNMQPNSTHNAQAMITTTTTRITRKKHGKRINIQNIRRDTVKCEHRSSPCLLMPDERRAHTFHIHYI